MITALKIVGGLILLLISIVALAIAIVPRFLDRIYYRGPVSDHFDGARFFNPDGDVDTFQVPTGGSRAGFLWRFFTGSDGRPAWPKSIPVAQARPEARIAGERMIATWIGHASMLVQTQGLNILTDPVWSEQAGPLGTGPRRVTRPGVAFDDLPRIDVVLLSHNHYDHLDIATLKRLWRRDMPLIVTSLGNDAILRATGIEAHALDWGEGIAVPGHDVEIVVTRNHHWSTRWSTDRNRALWSSFVIRLPGGNVFFAGDSGMGDGKWPAEAAAHGPIRLALIPIGAFRFVPDQMASGSHIGPVDAVEVFRRSGAAHAIPIHWGTFRLSYEAYDTPPKMLAEAMRCTGQTGFAPIAIGVPTAIEPYVPPAAAPPMPRDALLRCLATPAVKAMR